MWQNLSSAAVVICALRVKNCDKVTKLTNCEEHYCALQAKGTKSTSFLTSKEQSGLRTFGL